MSWRKLALATAFSFGAWIAIACTEAPIGAPVGDQNFDDPNDPGQVGHNNIAPEAGDANGKPCVAARDCPATDVCAYSIAAACQAAGQCMPNPDGGCQNETACGCDGTTVDFCAPAGYATKPVAFVGACDGGGADATGGDGATSDAVAE